MLLEKQIEEHTRWYGKLIDEQFDWSLKMLDDHIKWAACQAEATADVAGEARDKVEKDMRQSRSWIENHVKESRDCLSEGKYLLCFV